MEVIVVADKRGKDTTYTLEAVSVARPGQNYILARSFEQNNKIIRIESATGTQIAAEFAKNSIATAKAAAETEEDALLNATVALKDSWVEACKAVGVVEKDAFG